MTPPPTGPLETACQEMNARWAQGERVPVEHFLIRFPFLHDDPDAVLDLILLEVVLREEKGDAPTVAELVGRFPTLGEPLRSQLAFHDHLRHVDPTPTEPGVVANSGVVAGYRVVKELGRGGMGIVYEAIQLGLDRRVALKTLPREYPVGPHEARRFANEADALARLRHPNVLQIYEVGLHEGRPFIAFELMAGGTLADRLRAGPLPHAAAAALVRTLAQAVEVVHHSGLIHRDLKPANVLFTGVDDGGRSDEPKLSDFGLARLVDDRVGLTRTGDALGTPGYMAPEQVVGGRAVGPATDTYGLGTILYEALTGQPPFRGSSAAETLWQVGHVDPLPPSRLRPGVPRDLQTICLKCLEKSPARRYPSAAALADDLDRYLTGRPILARPLGPVDRVVKRARRHPLVTGLLAVLVFSVVTGLAGVVWNWQEAVRLAGAETQQRKRAEANLYRTRVSQAALLWQSNDIAAAREQLEACVPGVGQPDPRGWEWYYLNRLCDGSASEFTGADGWVLGLAVSPDGTEVAAATGTPAGLTRGDGRHGPVGSLVVWDAQSRKVNWRHGDAETLSVAYDPAGKLLAATTEAGEVTVFDRATRRERWSAKEPGPAHAVHFRPDGAQVAYVWKARTESVGCVIVRDAQTGRVVAELRRPLRAALAYSPDGARLYALRTDNAILSWEPRTGAEVVVPTGTELTADLVALDDDRVVCSCVGGGAAWDVRLVPRRAPRSTPSADEPADREIFSFAGHSGLVSALAFSPGRELVASGGADQAIRLWNVENGRERQVLRGTSGRCGPWRSARTAGGSIPVDRTGRSCGGTCPATRGGRRGRSARPRETRPVTSRV
ncbi:Serine/threonine protein kinase PrkC, regulator of stationary phase [Fimbriiglobus ruber]|uniref:Serine/threonine protein kinase PrkC, regulator of stationary phase n=1 Tax=Fimbriiglobus ruber TaxID=1908690 RepID=A0A225DS19_9BACT|nr:serine/threonine-protein kinase [Fimbriiglobus ruber]OWK39959.1 Serine/threonine protein kinase PrkC, regulator of stationary phase [Fimbriiglobus ruber]